MVINDTYVNDSIIARMGMVCEDGWCNGKQGTMIHADILTTYGTQIKIKCTREEYKSALNYVELEAENKRLKNEVEYLRELVKNKKE
jgi:hypothetical protein